MAQQETTQLIGPSESGTLPKSRLEDAAHAHSIYKGFKQDDRESAIQRTKIQAMFNGERPFSQAARERAGQSALCNLNFGESDAMKEDALSSYVDLYNSEESLIRLETRFGEPAQRGEWAEIIAREYTRMLKGWPAHFQRFMLNADYFVAHGVSVCYFPDDLDWRWDVARFGEFQIARETRATESEIEIAFLERKLNLAQLNSFIRNTQAATKAGWNIKQVKKAMLEHHAGSRGTESEFSPESFAEAMKSNDLFHAHRSKAVKIVHCWVKNFDGSVGHGIFLQDKAEKEWLYWNPNKFDRMTNAFIIYTFGVGDGYYHSIRGLGYKIFYQDNAANRMLSNALDGVNLRNSLIVQPGDENDLDKLVNMVQIGPMAVLAPGLKVQDPKFSSGDAAMQMVQQMRSFMRSKTNQYNPQNALPEGGPEKSRAEIVARLQEGARLSDSAKGLFYEPDTRHHRETFRRVMRRNYPESQAGGKEVQKMRQRLTEQGVPLEALFAVDLDSIRSVRSVGSGSPAAKELAMRQIMNLSGGYEETGRKQALLDATAAALNGDYETARKYVAPPPAPASAGQVTDAMMENILLAQGHEIPVVEGQLHLTHANIHLQKLQELEEGVKNGVEPMEVAEEMAMIQIHGTDHVERLSNDPSSTEDGAILRQAYQQFNQSINNGLNQLEAERQTQGANGGEQPDPEQVAFQQKLQQNAIEAQQKLAIKAAEAELDRQIKMAEGQQKIALEDAKAAATIRRDARLSGA